ncbi:cytochrome b-c1 complex subunit Rieske, mitochondrial-like [Coccinella septempunctata]|uniref:cytochrome b-c1 complex subunit Rieske, mitochondrial-like n=1 Tax=Coccinella septempunctata TaxID=41139 RepID=UPI001D05DDD0|nr:cytochrome b-c1 complex subunit Rieske, mitochondrial-like [Coccinella septempunctata]
MLSVLLRKKYSTYVNLRTFDEIRLFFVKQKGASTNFITLVSRGAHTDIKFPNFDKYRKKHIKDYEAKEGAKAAQGIVNGLFLVGFIYSAKSIAHFFIKSMSITADVQALAKVEIDLAEIAEGGHTTIKWRGKPLFLKHRLPDEIKDCRATPVSSLRDPETDEQRCPNPDWLVVIGVCTHLGCVPIPNAGDYLGGYYCPCHGSHYDAAGRIRKGPAPTNLEIPVHEFQADNKLVVG